jgi:hypothetical protein
MKVFIILVFALAAFSTNAATVVTYVNGADVDDAGAAKQQIAFTNAMRANGITDPSIKFLPRTIGQNTAEAFLIHGCQSALANTASPNVNSIPSTDQYKAYYKNLWRIYLEKKEPCLTSFIHAEAMTLRATGLAEQIKSTLSSGNTLVIVAYSQGNYYTEVALGKLLYDGYLQDFNKIRVVNIGNTALTSLNGFNVSSTLDTVVSSLNIAHFPATYVPCVNECLASISAADYFSFNIDSIGHYFTPNLFNSNTYLNEKLKTLQTKTSFPKVIASHVSRAIVELNAANIQISSVIPNTAEISKDTVFTVTGQNLTTGMGFAVGDCTPSSNELPGGTSSKRQYRCTINGVPGEKVGVLKAKPGDVASLYDFKINAIISPSSKWISTITPPGYVVKQIINADMSTWPSDGRIGITSGEYRINSDAVGCNLVQTTEVSGTRTGASFDLSVKYVSPLTTCTDGSHTATLGYTDTFTGTLNQGVLFVTPKTACSFELLSPRKCYNFESFAPIP